MQKLIYKYNKSSFLPLFDIALNQKLEIHDFSENSTKEKNFRNF